MLNRGMVTSHRRHAAILVGCLCFSVVVLSPHIIRPIHSTPVYAPLIAFLALTNIIALLAVKHWPYIATQSYWWSALVVVGLMTVHYNVIDGARGLPVIAAIPPLGAVFIRLLVSLRASIAYGIGTLAFLISAGVAADDLGRAVGYLAVGGLLVVICGLSLESPASDEPDMDTLCALRDALKVVDANTDVK